MMMHREAMTPGRRVECGKGAGLSRLGDSCICIVWRRKYRRRSRLCSRESRRGGNKWSSEGRGEKKRWRRRKDRES